MTSIFQRQLGAEFRRLHPRLQERFGIGVHDAVACVGTGVMDRVWRGRSFTLPFLTLGTARHILFPDRGEGVPFTIENYVYLDSFGRETVTFARTFRFPNRARYFDATMVYSPDRGKVIDYLGTHQHVAVDLDLRVDDAGGLRIRTGSMRFVAPLASGVPGVIRADAQVHEWFDDDADRFRIEVQVRNRWFGPLFGYHGSFTAEYPAVERVPDRLRPRHESRRE
jgi:hypothetical protein